MEVVGCAGRHARDQAVRQGKRIEKLPLEQFPDGDLWFPLGVAVMQLTSSGKLPLEIPAAVEQIMRDRDCLKTFDDFCLALRHRNYTPTCCAAGLLKDRTTPERRREIVILAFIPRFAEAKVEIRLCRTGATGTDKAWLTFVDRTVDSKYEPPCSVKLKEDGQNGRKPVSFADDHNGRSHVDFSGSWLLVRLDGDMDALLAELGTSEADRAAWSKQEYGVSEQVQNIKHTSTDLIVEVTGFRPAKQRYSLVDMQRQAPVNGKSVDSAAFWASDEVLEVVAANGGRKVLTTRRYMIGKELVTELVSGEGIVVKTVYVRVPS
mmetsp:Transcript_53494/g.98950  ORF Transcript_53494/g.98950 Transcript_53494/m.98950 type:complete len:320 (+) Transcript_53494:1-960(+)